MRIARRVQQGRLQRSSLFLVHALQRRLLLLQPRVSTEATNDEFKYRLPNRGSPFKGLGVIALVVPFLGQAETFLDHGDR